MPEIYTPLDFPGYPDPQNLVEIGNLLTKLANYCILLCNFVMYIGVIVNIFHLLVLTRKPLRNSTINVILMVIAISDLEIIIYTFFQNYFEDLLAQECTPPFSETQLIFYYRGMLLTDFFNRMPSWFSLFLASIRYFIVKKATSPRFQFFSRPGFALKILACPFVVSGAISSFYLLRIRTAKSRIWVPDKSCGFPENFTAPEFSMYPSGSFFSGVELFETFLMLDGYLKVIPLLVLPVFTVLLISEMRKAEELRRKASSSEQQSSTTDRTTKLVVILTIFCFFSEGPRGFIYIIQFYLYQVPGFLKFTNDILWILLIFTMINSSVHCFVCLGVSSQYRETAKKMFLWGRIRKQKTVTITPRLSNASINSTR